jgi:endonuclease III related protein
MTATDLAERRVAAHDEFLLDTHQRLLSHYGPQGWWPGETAIEVIVGAILTQSAAWTNVERALANVQRAGLLSVEGLRAAAPETLAQLIRPSGYFNAKAAKLKAFIATLDEHYGGGLDRMLAAPVDELRSRLLETHGIGPETADAIMLYAAGSPSFVVDAYTHRIFRRLGMQPAHDTYESWHGLFMAELPGDPQLMNEYHALLVTHGKTLCRKRDPLCSSCPLVDICAYGRSNRPAV